MRSRRSLWSVLPVVAVILAIFADRSGGGLIRRRLRVVPGRGGRLYRHRADGLSGPLRPSGRLVQLRLCPDLRRHRLQGGKLSHQPQIGVWQDIKGAGTFGASAWLDFYSTKLDEETGSGALHEGDYTAYWAYPIEPLSMAVELGWTARTFPQFSGG